MIKIILRLTCIAIAVVALVVAVTLIAPNKTLRPLLANYATKLLGTDVTIEELEICLRCSHLQLNNIMIKSPEGFGDQTLLRADEINIELQLKQLYQHPLPIDRVSLRGVQVNYLKNNTGRSNITQLLANLPQPDLFLAREPSEDTVDKLSTHKLFIDHLIIAGTAVTASSPQLGSEKLQLKLATIDLFELGGNDGQPVATIAAQVLARIQLELGAALLRSPAFRARIQQQATDRLLLRSLEIKH